MTTEKTTKSKGATLEKVHVTLTPEQVAELKNRPLSEEETIRIYRIIASPPRVVTPRAKAAMKLRKAVMSGTNGHQATYTSESGKVFIKRG